MIKELLMLYGAKKAVLRMIEKGSAQFAMRKEGKKWETVEWIDIFDFLEALIDKFESEEEE